VIGTWRDNMKVNRRRSEGQKWFARHGMQRADQRRRLTLPDQGDVQIKDAGSVRKDAHISAVNDWTTSSAWKSTTSPACAACIASTS
jgi:hypothetical protein